MDGRQLDLQDFAIAARKTAAEVPVKPVEASPAGAIGPPHSMLAQQTDQSGGGGPRSALVRNKRPAIASGTSSAPISAASSSS